MDNRSKSKPTTGHADETIVEQLAAVISPDHLSEEDDHRMVVVNEETIKEYSLDFITGESKESLLFQARRAEERGEVVTVLLFDYNKNKRELDQFYVEDNAEIVNKPKEETDDQFFIKSNAAELEDGNLSVGPVEIKEVRDGEA